MEFWTIVTSSLFEDGRITYMSVGLTMLMSMFYVYKYEIKPQHADIKIIKTIVKKLADHQIEIERKQANAETMLAVHAQESSDNAMNMRGIQGDVSKIEGMLSIMGFNTSRGIK